MAANTFLLLCKYCGNLLLAESGRVGGSYDQARKMKGNVCSFVVMYVNSYYDLVDEDNRVGSNYEQGHKTAANACDL